MATVENQPPHASPRLPHAPPSLAPHPPRIPFHRSARTPRQREHARLRCFLSTM
jgi:hypothetical protein